MSLACKFPIFLRKSKMYFFCRGLMVLHRAAPDRKNASSVSYYHWNTQNKRLNCPVKPGEAPSSSERLAIWAKSPPEPARGRWWSTLDLRKEFQPLQRKMRKFRKWAHRLLLRRLSNASVSYTSAGKAREQIPGEVSKMSSPIVSKFSKNIFLDKKIKIFRKSDQHVKFSDFFEKSKIYFFAEAWWSFTGQHRAVKRF